MGDISNEPSMEDILASIRRIIADDPGQQSDVIAAEEVRTMVKGQSETIDNEEDEVLNLAPEQFADEPAPAPTASLLAEKRNPSAEPILSKASAEASRASLSSLSKMIVRQEDASSNTLEGLVRDLLKPMIKPWLDDHLPAIVERAVAQEVARLSGRDV